MKILLFLALLLPTLTLAKPPKKPVVQDTLPQVFTLQVLEANNGGKSLVLLALEAQRSGLAHCFSVRKLHHGALQLTAEWSANLPPKNPQWLEIAAVPAQVRLCLDKVLARTRLHKAAPNVTAKVLLRWRLQIRPPRNLRTRM